MPPIAAGLAAAPLAFVRTFDRARLLAASRHAEFARATGIQGGTLMRRDLAYEFRDTFLTIAARALAAVTIMLSTVSFLGFGAVPPHRDLGLMIAAARATYLDAWWTAAFPALALAAADPVCAAWPPRSMKASGHERAVEIKDLSVSRPGSARPELDRLLARAGAGRDDRAAGRSGLRQGSA